MMSELIPSQGGWFLDYDQLSWPRGIKKEDPVEEEEIKDIISELKILTKGCKVVYHGIVFTIGDKGEIVGDLECTVDDEEMVVLYDDLRRISSMRTTPDVEIIPFEKETWKQSKLRRGQGHNKLKSKKSRGKK